MVSHDCTRGGQGAPRTTHAWKTTHAGPRGSVKACEHKDRDLPAGLVLILDKNGHLGGLAVEQALALLPSGHSGLDPKALGAHFDRRLRVREEVVVPGGVLGGAGERGDHDEALAIGVMWIYSSGHTETRTSRRIRGVFDEPTHDENISR